jgi:hypothetical protein
MRPLGIVMLVWAVAFIGLAEVFMPAYQTMLYYTGEWRVANGEVLKPAGVEIGSFTAKRQRPFSTVNFTIRYVRDNKEVTLDTYWPPNQEWSTRQWTDEADVLAQAEMARKQNPVSVFYRLDRSDIAYVERWNFFKAFRVWLFFAVPGFVFGAVGIWALMRSKTPPEMKSF